MRTEDLIADLASRATPVRPLAQPVIRAMGWTAVAIACAAAGLAAFGLRHDVTAHLAQPDVVWTSILAVATALSAAMASLVLAIPAAERSPALRITSAVFVAVWTAILVTLVARAGHGLDGISDWPICFVRVVAISLTPAIVLLGMLRRAAPLRLRWTGALAAAAALSVGAFVMPFVCPIDDAGHALLGHLGPVLVFGGIAAMAARTLLQRRRR